MGSAWRAHGGTTCGLGSPLGSRQDGGSRRDLLRDGLATGPPSGMGSPLGSGPLSPFFDGSAEREDAGTSVGPPRVGFRNATSSSWGRPRALGGTSCGLVSPLGSRQDGVPRRALRGPRWALPGLGSPSGHWLEKSTEALGGPSQENSNAVLGHEWILTVFMFI